MQMEPTMSPEENLNSTENQGEEKTPSVEENTIPPEKEANTTAVPNAEEEKKEVVKETESEIVLKLDELSLEEYPALIDKILKNEQWMKFGTQVRELQASFEKKFQLKVHEKKEAFIAEGGNEIDFYFAPEYKKNFSFLLKEYKNKKGQHFREIEANQKANLSRKKEIIEEIKKLIDQSEHNSTSYKQFKSLQEAFHNTGQVPRADSNNIWQTYKFHVERFYDFLHLNRDLRDADFKHNYAEKLKIIERAEELAQHTDVIASIRELNNLHRLWKNDLGPVAREHRDDLWNRFQAATKTIHHLKNEYNKNIDSIQDDNLAIKDGVLNEITKLLENKPENHNAWQNAIKKVNALKEKFHAVGRVPKSENKRLWNSFRELSRQFNQDKNYFYKQQKAEEKGFVDAKRALIDEVKTILDDPNYRDYINRMKAVQNDWKKTGRISRKLSNKLWEEFKTLTNLYFDRLKNKVEALSAEDQAKLASQTNFVEEVIKTESPTTPKKLETFIEEQVEQWQGLNPNASSPAQRKLINHLVGLWDATSLSTKEKAVYKFATQLSLIKNDADALNKEHAAQKKKIDEISTELIQLQNNLQFFSNSSSDNPMVVEVNKKIEQLSKQKEVLSEKTNAIKSFVRNLNKQSDEGVTETTEDTEAGED
ncbi:DUF349 domain-containing protein [Flavobacteriaceae bacterium]|nr:DUF349 domain-containing protein [Flavobacteriaceae bacterium]